MRLKYTCAVHCLSLLENGMSKAINILYGLLFFLRISFAVIMGSGLYFLVQLRLSDGLIIFIFYF